MLRSRWVDLALIVAIVPLGVWAWRTGGERARLEEKYAQYARKVGDLPVSDPSKIYVQALKTDEPLHFAWRVYFPPGNYQLIGLGGTGEFSSAGTGQRTIRCAIRSNDRGKVQLFAGNSGDNMSQSSSTEIGNEELARLLRERLGEITVEQVAPLEVIAADPSKPLVMLRLKFPADPGIGTTKELADQPTSLQSDFFTMIIEPQGQNP